MKKSILIIVVVMGFGVLSCEKRECSKNSQEAEAPTWRSVKVNRDVEGGGHGGPVVDTGGSITDPNDDEDGNGRKKVR